ncbi:uncharacterized protein BDZ99DRAFT_536721 [Mytilinidion resinicola]|uniref:Rhodopsin domain-containing protein n=1 Tax=Mytilinidion resinicola TaxID=574789 RepID=A0A6A6YH45_9PEZI|nr:uncharacterized protein BDZ99DRAFT_536721 [Mytilinidion resinicola]KAF2807324.1 hypothetical protein BDZ99DRAFT_536721 [Mytilinidion resinicola]
MDQAEKEYLKIWLSHTVMGVAATIAIVLRFIARRRTKAVLKWDDWIALSALLFMWGDFACTILGKSFILNIWSTDSILTIWPCRELVARMSVIFLYYRLFSIKRWLGWSLKTVGALSILWLLCLIFTVSFQCKPIAALLDATVAGECLDNQTGFLSSEIFNACLDLALVCLPIRIIWKLRLPLRERFGIATIFLTGGL